jgi:RNA polymerase sigma-70 factor (ECF subfamily)
VSETSLPPAPPEPEAFFTGPSDHDLIRSAQRGEEPAFAELVRRHEERAVRVALALIASREDARDLAQEAFLRVFRNLERFDFQHEFTTWLYRIVTNLAIDLLRKRRPVRSTTAEQEEEADLDLADPEASAPSDAMESLETAERVRACIDRLAPHFRSVMILRELEGLPCTEIARIVGTTHVTVRWRLHRGRKLFLEEWERMERETHESGAASDGAEKRRAGGSRPNSSSEVP